jgi:hypothetical protein
LRADTNHLEEKYCDNPFMIPYSPSGHIVVDTIINLGINNVPRELDTNGFFHINSLMSPGATNELILNIKYNCTDTRTVDTLWLYYGCNCYNYPASLQEACYYDSAFYILHIEPAGLQLQVSSNDSVAPCDTLTYHLVFSATQTGSIYHVSDTITLPPGLSYVTGSGSVTFNSTIQSLPPAFDSIPHLVWNFDSVAWIANNLRDTASFELTFQLAIGCGYPGINNGILNNYNAVSYCGMPISQRPIPQDIAVLSPDHCNPHCLIASIGNDTIICITQSDTLYANASGGYPPYTYSWSTGDTLDFIVIFPTSDTLVSVTVTDSIGQTYTDEISIRLDQCFCTVADKIIADGTHSSTILPGYSNRSVIIQGRFFVDSSFYFDSCQVHMWPNAEIDVLYNSTLTIDSSHLFACTDTMWTGIIIYDSSTVVINNSIIEDALTAVNVDGNNTASPVVTIDSSVFDHNSIGLYVYGAFNLTASCTVRRSIFQCTGGIWKYPFSGGNSKYHIYCEMATMKIGDETDVLPNNFLDADFGIYGLRSDLTVYNNSFTNIGNFYQDASNSGVFSSFWFNRPAYLKVGNDATPVSGINYSNEFKQCFNGIVTQKPVKSSIYKNTFDACNTGITVNTNSYYDPVHITPVDIRSNYLNNCIDGIMLYDLRQIKMVVDSNTIYSPYTDNGIPMGKHGIALYNSDLFGDTMDFNVNEVTDYQYCMLMVNAGTKTGWFNVENNAISFNFDSLHLGSQFYRGIRMENCRAAKVNENTISWNSGMSDPAAINAYIDSIQGIRIEDVSKSVYSCNDIVTCGSGIFIQNNCSGTYLHYNTLDNNYPGMNFSSIVLPDQGGTNAPAGNEWYGTYTNANGRVTGSGISFNYYYNTSTQLPQPPIFPFLITILTGSGSNNCSTIQPGDTIKIDKELRSIIDSSSTDSTSDFPEEGRYKKNEYAYQTMKVIPELVNTDDRFYFMDTTQESNIGILTEVKDLMVNGDSLEAADINGSVVSTNVIEENKKVVNEIYLSTADTISSADTATLVEIAYQFALEGGEAVHWSRGKLRLDIEDSYSAAARNGKAKPKNDISSEVSLYPNPSNERVNIISKIGNLQFVSAENIWGENVYFEKFNNKKATINISNLPNGTYILRIYLENKKEVQKKLTIIH